MEDLLLLKPGSTIERIRSGDGSSNLRDYRSKQQAWINEGSSVALLEVKLAIFRQLQTHRSRETRQDGRRLFE